MHLFLLSESVASSVPQLLRTMVEEARIYYREGFTSGIRYFASYLAYYRCS